MKRSLLWIPMVWMTFLGPLGSFAGEDIPPPPLVAPTPIPTDTPVPFRYQVPRKLKDGWPVVDLRDEKGDLAKLAEGYSLIESNQLTKMHSILIFRYGKLLYESYFNGFKESETNSIFSCTKSVFSSVFGIAQDQGLLNIKQKLYDLYPDERGKEGWDPRKEGITLHHLLCMTTGLTCDDMGVGDDNCGSMMGRSKDWLGFCFTLPMAHTPGETWMYNGACLSLISNLIVQKSGMAFPEYARKYLLGPLEIPGDDWITGPNGVNRVDYGLYWTSRDMAKLGQLYLDQGMWKGKRILSKSWVKAATSFQAPMEKFPSNSYGYLWWLSDAQWKGKKIPYFYASGYQGQAIFVAREAGLVCVMTAASDDYQIYGKEKDLFEKYVLGAFQ